MSATGSSLTIYVSDPPSVHAVPGLQDAVEGAQLSFGEHQAEVRNASLRLLTGTASAPANARAAIALNSLVAYVGEVGTGESRQTVGILNTEDVLELSPTDTVSPGKNDFEDLSTYGRTFASLPLDLGTAPATLQRAVPGFRATFTRFYGHAPSAQAIEGYDAMWVLLRVIAALKGHANDRTRIAKSVIATLQTNHGRASVPNFTITLK
ncbi:MAG TPA: hypothetical protein VFN48_06665 [Solirubrobacteraceae bacterium]|nr:hypothetical protein [Solirubrobacteraceae bacterium]